MNQNVEMPDADDSVALRRAANENLFIGMNSPTQLEAEGGPMVPTSSRGIYVSDIDGREYIDGIASMWAVVHGHNHPKIVDAIIEHFVSSQPPLPPLPLIDPP